MEEEKGRFHVDVDHLLPFTQGKVLDELGVQRAAGKIHQEIDSAMIGDDLGNHLRDLSLAGQLQRPKCAFSSMPREFGHDLSTGPCILV